MTRSVAAVLLVLYSFVIVRLTLTDPSSASWVFSLADETATRVSGGRLDWSQTEVLANIALFVPAGLLLAVVVNSAWLGAGLCVLGSALIELAQLTYLPLRVPSGADVLHNAYGAVLGALVAVPVLLAARRTPERTQVDITDPLPEHAELRRYGS